MIVLLSAGKEERTRVVSKQEFFLSISVLIVNLKQQEIHCDPQPFSVRIHSHLYTPTNAAIRIHCSSSNFTAHRYS